MELQELANLKMVGCHIPAPPTGVKAATNHIHHLEAEGVHLYPQQLQELKALAMEWDEQGTRAMAEEDWHGLLDRTQYLFRASSIPFGLAHLLHHL